MRDLLSFANDGRGILFVGSGFNFRASSYHSDHIATVDDLIEFFNEPYKGNFFHNYRAASERYIRDPNYGSAAAYAGLKPRFSTRTYAEHHKKILSLHWRRIYTTNYDDLIERTLTDLSTPFESLNSAVDTRSYDARKTSVVHLNGSFSNASTVDFDKLVRLTEASYLAEKFSQHPYFIPFRQELKTSSCIFVVGYSFPDIDISRIFKTNDEISRKTIIVTAPNSNPEDIFTLESFGSVHPIGVERFSEEIDKSKENYKPRTALERLYNIRTINNDDIGFEKIGDSARYELFVHGRFIPNLYKIQSSETASDRYSVRRDATRRIISQIKKEKSVICVSGNLASGKSIISEQVCLDAAQIGFDVFIIERRSEFLLNEIDRVLQSRDRQFLMVFENYERYFDEIQFALGHYQSAGSFLLTSRELLHEANRPRIKSYVKSPSVYKEFSVSRLMASERNILSEILDSPEFRGAFDKNKVTINATIEFKCKSEFGAVLVLLLRSPAIKQKIAAQFDQASLSDQERAFLAIILIIRIFGFEVNLFELNDAFSFGQHLFTDLSDRPVVNELVLANAAGEVHVSPAFSQHLLATQYSPADIRNALERITSISHKNQNTLIFSDIYRSSIQYGRLIDIFPDSDKLNEINTFYDNVKNLSAVNTNPYFWLQYAISCWAISNRGLTDSFIAEARRVGAGMPGFSSFQIDNFEAKVILEDEERNSKPEESYENIKAAADIFYRQIDDPRTKHYPLQILEKITDRATKMHLRFDKKRENDVIRILRNLDKRLASSDINFEYMERSQRTSNAIAKLIRNI